MQTTYSYSLVFELQIIFSLKCNFSSQKLCFYVAPKAKWSFKYCIPCGSCFCTEYLLCPQPWLDHAPSFPDPEDPAAAALFPIQTYAPYSRLPFQILVPLVPGAICRAEGKFPLKHLQLITCTIHSVTA